MSQTSYDDALRALAASEGIEYVDCRVTPDWGSDRPVRHDHLRVVGPSASGESSRPKSGRGAEAVTAGRGLGDDVPLPAPLLLRSTYEQLMLDPRHREAAAKGLKIHEAALARAQAEGISYEQALEDVK